MSTEELIPTESNATEDNETDGHEIDVSQHSEENQNETERGSDSALAVIPDEADLQLNFSGQSESPDKNSNEANDSSNVSQLDVNQNGTIEQVIVSPDSALNQTVATDESDPLAPIIKPEPALLIEPCTSNSNELNGLFDKDYEEEDVWDEDITFIVNKKVGYAQPFNSNDQQLIKRENDVVSGNMPFNETVNTQNMLTMS